MNEIPNKVTYLVGMMDGDEFWCRLEKEDLDEAVLVLKQLKEMHPEKECTIYRKLVSFVEVAIKD